MASKNSDNIQDAPPEKKTPPTPRKSSGNSLEAAAKKARKTLTKVTDTVKEIAEKVSRRKTHTTLNAPAAKAAGRLDKSMTPNRSKPTRVGALAPGVTTQDVQDTLLDSHSSTALQEPESPSDLKEQFFHDQNRQAEAPPEAARELPETYGDTRLVLLVRDPEWVYAYWEINEETRNHLTRQNINTDQNLTLRMFKITDRNWPEEAAHYFFDVTVDANAQSWYIHLPETSQNWCAELGTMDETHSFNPICRSNPFYTPRNSISDEVDSEWMTVEESFEKITRLSSAALEARLRGDSPTTSESILRHIHKQITGINPGQVVTLSSHSLSSDSAIPATETDFWLKINTELILYGATEPDAQLTVQGKPVKLNPDGTFTLRYALPDGEISLPVRAVKSTGDREKTITPVVTRKTH